MSPRAAFSIFLFLGAAIGPTAGEAQQKFLWQAEVTSDHLKVFTEVSAPNELVMQLRKGNVVNVVLEISVLGDKWCRIALGSESEPVGYSLCKELKPLTSAVKQGSQIEPVILTHRQPAAITTGTGRSADKEPGTLGMLTNRDILDMISAGLPQDILIAKIRSSLCNFNTTPRTLEELKTGGVPEAVILAMVEAPVVQPKESVAESRDPEQPASTRASSTTPAPITTKIVAGSKVYITPMDGFENYLAAAFGKKKVQLVLVVNQDQADYVISGTSLDKKAGWAKIVFMGNIHSDNAASVTMSDRKTGAILYAYAVDKKSTMHGQQTTAEACAKHLQAHIEGRN